MGVELTPNGTYGAAIPNIPRPIMKVVFGLLSTFIKLRGGRILDLITTGSKSGIAHRVPLSWFSDGDNAWLIVGSMGGAAKHPAWYFNMVRNPDKVWIEVDKDKIQVQGESLKGAAYDTAWNKIVAAAPNYGAYKGQTDRQIPVVRLTPKN